MSTNTVRLSRKELYEQVWSEPMTKLAKKYGLSDVGLRKRCVKFKIPLPGAGYWAKKQWGKVGPRPPLPHMKEADIVEFDIIKREKHQLDAEQNTEAQVKIAFEKLDKNRIRVTRALRNPHPYVAQTEKILRNTKPNTDDNGFLNPKAQCLDIGVTPKSLSRALRIMDVLVKSLEARGFDVTIINQSGCVTSVTVLDETFEFGLKELLKQIEHKPTPAELKEKERYPFLDIWHKYDYIPSGRLSLMIKTYVGDGIRRTWTDGKKQRVEDCLNAFIIELIKAAVEEKADRLMRERRKRERQEQERRREEIARLRREEEMRVQALMQNAADLHKSRQVREYIEAVRKEAIRKYGEIVPGSEIDRWLKWANDQADRLDPLVESPPSVLDEENEDK